MKNNMSFVANPKEHCRFCEKDVKHRSDRIDEQWHEKVPPEPPKYQSEDSHHALSSSITVHIPSKLDFHPQLPTTSQTPKLTVISSLIVSLGPKETNVLMLAWNYSKSVGTLVNSHLDDR